MNKVLYILLLCPMFSWGQDVNFTIDDATVADGTVTQTVTSGGDTYVLSAVHGSGTNAFLFDTDPDPAVTDNLFFWSNVSAGPQEWTVSVTKNGDSIDFDLVNIDFECFDQFDAHNFNIVNDNGMVITSNYQINPLTTGSFPIDTPANASGLSNFVLEGTTDEATLTVYLHNITISPGTSNPVCTLELGTISAACDANTSDTDSVTISIPYTNADSGDTYTITTTPAATQGGDDPQTTADGTMTFTGIDEDTDFSITVTSTNGCDLNESFTVPSCDAPTCTLSIGTPTSICDTETTEEDLVTISIPYTDGDSTDTYTITTTPTTTRTGDDPAVTPNGTMLFTGVNENTAFTINIESTNGCDLSSSFTTEVCEEDLSLNENESFSFAVFPNPASNFIEIESSLLGDKEIRIYDMLGKMALKSSQDRIDIRGLKSGMYLIEISQNGRRSIKKFIVK